MKRLFYIFLLLICSCSSDHIDSPDVNNETFYRLIKTIEKDKDGNIEATTNYDYNDQGQLIKAISVEGGITYISTISYNNGKPISISKSQGVVLTYTYNGDLIVGMAVTEDGILFTHEYAYNASKQLISDKQYDDGVFCCENTFEYNSSGNKIKQNGITLDYEYDDKKNPNSVLYPLELLRIDDHPNNNIIKRNSKTVNSYTYNEKGYPTISHDLIDNEVYYTTEYYYDEI